MSHILLKENFQAIHQELVLVKSSGQLFDCSEAENLKKKLTKFLVVLHIVTFGKLNFPHIGQGSETLQLRCQKTTLRKNGQFNFDGHLNFVAWNVLKIL